MRRFNPDSTHLPAITVMRISPRTTLLFGLLYFSLLRVGAQDLDVGVTVGGGYYLGDLNPGFHFKNTQPAYGALVRYNLDTRWAVKLTATMGKVEASAATSGFLPERELTFSSNITDISATMEFNFMRYFTGSHMNAYSPYIYTGFSVFFFNPESNGVKLQPLGTEGQNVGYLGRTPYSLTSFSIPFGLGGKLSIGGRFGLQVYWEMHKTFTDYLDDVSTTYYLDGKNIPAGDLVGIMSDPSRNHAPGMQRGYSKNKDWYTFFGASVTYKFNLLARKKCRELNH